MPYFIGLDFGTDSVRALLVNEFGKSLAVAVHPYARWKQGLYCDAANNQFRQHPLDYLEGLETVIKDVLKGIDASQVKGIGVDTTGSTPCVVDASGTPLALTPDFAENPNAMFVLWKDHTAIKEAEEITAAAKSAAVDYTQYEGGTYSAEWFWSKLLHVLRVDEKVRNAAYSCVEHCDWISAELTGKPLKPGRCAAGHKALWHASWGGLPPVDFFAGIDPLLVPLRNNIDYTETFTADIPVGTLSAKWAARLGLPEDVVVSGGAIDAHVGAIGAGIQANQMVKVIGTSTCDIIVTPNLTKCIPGICGQVDGSVLPNMVAMEAGQSAFGDIYAWFVRMLSYAGDINLAALEKDAIALPDCDVMALDWMNGRRSPDANPNLKGAIFGINLGTTAPMIYRALVESTAFGSRAILERLQSEGVQIDGIIAMGGIAHKSPLCMQFLSDVLNQTVKVSASDQACALGAAMLAATASGFYPNLATASQKMNQGIDAEYTPKKNYDARFKKYIEYAKLLENEQ